MAEHHPLENASSDRSVRNPPSRRLKDRELRTTPCKAKAAPEFPADADGHYALAVELLGPALGRLAAGYEASPVERQDLLQDIHLQLWRSLARFDGRCSLRTWVYRVAHNVAADHVARSINSTPRHWTTVVATRARRGCAPSATRTTMEPSIAIQTVIRSRP